MTKKGIKYAEQLARDEVVGPAVNTLCETLDATWPGWDRGGIDSNFQGKLEDFIISLLRERNFVVDDREPLSREERSFTWATKSFPSLSVPRKSLLLWDDESLKERIKHQVKVLEQQGRAASSSKIDHIRVAKGVIGCSLVDAKNFVDQHFPEL